MELISLRYFVTVAEELHFRRAAEKLHMTQGPLSVAIRKLEDELEVELFERSSRSVKLTEAGEFFLAEAEAVLKRAELAKKNLQQRVFKCRRHLVIGYNESALNTVLPGVLSHYHKYLSDIELELRELETSEQIKALHEGTLDLGYMRPFGFDLGELESKIVHREHYKLVMPESHPLACKNEITLQMLANQDIVLFARDVNPELFDILKARMSAVDMTSPHFQQNARTKSSMLAMVRAGFGIALLPESSLNENMHGMRICTPAFELPSIEIMAVWHPERKPPAYCD
ncbi:MAG: LysR family transcriptional regulator [Lentisphaeria bacterium]|nr:LysR family transcriptional regulator [Lentisphaeria bacterium]